MQAIATRGRSRSIRAAMNLRSSVLSECRVTLTFVLAPQARLRFPCGSLCLREAGNGCDLLARAPENPLGNSSSQTKDEEWH
jgi:hypothetical protein